MKKIICLFLCLCFVSCQSTDHSTKESKPASILVTLPPYAYFVQKITQGLIPTQILVPHGTNPHIYEPSPQQVSDILKTSIWFRLGEPIEEKVVNILKSHNSKVLDVDLSQGIALLDDASHIHAHVDDGKDRHFWLSPKIAQMQAKMIAKTLIEHFPEYSLQLTRGLNELTIELALLDSLMAQKLKAYENKTLLVSHPAFGYFCQEFHLNQLSIECEGKDPLPKHIEHVLKKSQEIGITEVLTQKSHNNKAATLISEQLHIPIYEVDPYAMDYVSNLLHMTEIIAHEKK